jgi:hypothetical protein
MEGEGSNFLSCLEGETRERRGRCPDGSTAPLFPYPPVFRATFGEELVDSPSAALAPSAWIASSRRERSEGAAIDNGSTCCRSCCCSPSS